MGLDIGKEFIWFSEKDGWRHLYRISHDGKETKITNGDYDVIDLLNIDEKNRVCLFLCFACKCHTTISYTKQN